MPSKKRVRRQLQRKRRLPQDVSAFASSQTKTEGTDVTAKNETVIVRNPNSISGHSFLGSVMAWIHTSGGAFLRSTESNPSVTSLSAIVSVLGVSLVVGNYKDWWKQGMAIHTSAASSSNSVVVMLCAAVSVSVGLPFLLWWILGSTSRRGRIREGEDGRNTNTNIKSCEGILEEEPTSVDDDDDDEFSRIRPLGLKRPLEATDSSNKEGNDNDYGSDAIVAQPQLATSQVVRTKLAEWLPFGLRYTSDLNLVFSTHVHGRSLQTLYHRLDTTSSTHTILLAEAFAQGTPSMDTATTIVGMYASQRWHSSRNLYGDGRSFLFRMVLPAEAKEEDTTTNEPTVSRYDCWKWTPLTLPASHSSTSKRQRDDHAKNHLQHHENDLSLWETFQRSNHDRLSLGIGASGVGAGLQFNHDLTLGESHPAVGFDNEPLVSEVGGGDASNTAKGVTFDVGLVEVYQLVREIDGRPIQ